MQEIEIEMKLFSLLMQLNPLRQPPRSSNLELLLRTEKIAQYYVELDFCKEVFDEDFDVLPAFREECGRDSTINLVVIR